MIRSTALLLTVLTGFSGLVYEVTWQKYLATLLGSHSEATAAVLGLFLGGLALGYSLFGRVTRRLVAAAAAAGRRSRLLTVYGLLEAGIGAYALLFPALFRGIQAFSFAVPHGFGGLGFAFDVALSALLIAPPAVLMGGTIPMLTQALARSMADATRFHALVYALNTAGAFAGALAAGYWLVPTLGLIGTLAAMSAVNLAAGAVFVALGQLGSGQQPPVATGPPGRVRIAGFATYAAVALLIGFAMMTLQTVLIRLGGLSFGSSQFTFSMVVAVFVLCIALGSLAVSALPRIPRGLLVASLWGTAVIFYLLYEELENAPYWAHVLRSLFANHPAGFYPYYLVAFVGVLAVIGVPVALSGATLPLIFDHLRREFGELGGTAGRLYSWNTVGSLLGALLGGYALLYWLDLHEVFRIAIAALAVGAVMITQRVFAVAKLAVTALLLAPVLAAIALLPPWAPERITAGLFRNRVALDYTFEGPDLFFAKHGRKGGLIFFTDDPNTTVTVGEVVAEDGVAHRYVATNGKSDGTVPGEYLTMAMASLLPALMAERAERAFVIGYGTGVTVGEIASIESVREVIVAEISPGVIEAAPLFDEANLQASRNPKVKIVQSDAYRALLRSEGRFDVIASEPSNPWVTGVEMLYSKEFLEAARDRLSPGGVYSQWFHTYEIDAATVAMVLRTYTSVFDHVAVWYALGPDLLLIGLRDPETALDLDRLIERGKRPDFAASLRRCDIQSLPTLLAHELLPLGVVHAAALTGEIHTLFHPRLSTMAARAYFAGGAGRQLPQTAGLEAARLGARNSLVRRLAARRGGRLSELQRGRLVAETCKHRPVECLTLLAEWAHEVPVSPARARLKERIARSPILGRTTDLKLLKPLARLFGDSAAPAGGNALEAARRATERFSSFYHHAAPFPRSALAALWRRCESDPEQSSRCLAGRAEAERELGDLDEQIDGSHSVTQASPRRAGGAR